MNKSLYLSLFTAVLATSTQGYAFDIKQGHILAEVGAFRSAQGQTQTINISGLIGDRFWARDRHDANALLGLAYMINGYTRDKLSIDFGLNAFYLDNTRVSGVIFQKLLFENLAYSYEVSHLPVYANAKATIKSNSDKYAVTVDAGIGPNFINTHSYRDWSLNGVTSADNAFIGHGNTVFSAMAGVGIQVNQFFGKWPFEVGYRFFYLGKGSFRPRTDLILDSLGTGTNYAQAVIATVRF